MRFVIGVDTRAVLAADLERRLRATYCISEFRIFGISCGLHCRTPSSIATQVDFILQGLLDFPAQYIVGISSGVVVDNYGPCGPIPYPVTVMTVMDTDGAIQADCVEKIGYSLPWEIRRRCPSGEPDLIDILCEQLVEVIGTEPQPILIPPVPLS
jgi:hypothetical protein